MKLNRIFSHFGRISASVLAAMLCIVSLSSCGDWLNEEEDDCEPHYKVKFRYDYNLNKADAFAQEVNAVTLYIINPETGQTVWRRTESSDVLKDENYLMDIEGLKPGNYKLMAWAGDGHLNRKQFTLSDASDDYTTYSCSINRKHLADGTAEVDSNLNRLYKDLPQEFTVREFPDQEGTYIYPVRLMRNTNDITIVLQHLSGEPIDPNAFEYRITEANGLMNYDNSLAADDTLTYRPWNIRPGIAVGYLPSNMAEAQFSAAIANFTVGRLMADRKMMLTITRKSDGSVVARVPVIEYALMVKTNYDAMPDQEYLDRQHQYSMVFFLDESLNYISTTIYINSWHVVVNNVEIGK